MRVLVTGHNGYVGTILVPMLLNAGHDVVGMDTNLYEGSTFGEDNETQDIPFVFKDVRDVELAMWRALMQFCILPGYRMIPWEISILI